MVVLTTFKIEIAKCAGKVCMVARLQSDLNLIATYLMFLLIVIGQLALEIQRVMVLDVLAIAFIAKHDHLIRGGMIHGRSIIRCFRWSPSEGGHRRQCLAVVPIVRSQKCCETQTNKSIELDRTPAVICMCISCSARPK